MGLNTQQTVVLSFALVGACAVVALTGVTISYYKLWYGESNVLPPLYALIVWGIFVALYLVISFIARCFTSGILASVGADLLALTLLIIFGIGANGALVSAFIRESPLDSYQTYTPFESAMCICALSVGWVEIVLLFVWAMVEAVYASRFGMRTAWRTSLADLARLEHPHARMDIDGPKPELGVRMERIASDAHVPRDRPATRPGDAGYVTPYPQPLQAYPSSSSGHAGPYLSPVEHSAYTSSQYPGAQYPPLSPHAAKHAQLAPQAAHQPHLAQTSESLPPYPGIPAPDPAAHPRHHHTQLPHVLPPLPPLQSHLQDYTADVYALGAQHGAYPRAGPGTLSSPSDPRSPSDQWSNQRSPSELDSPAVVLADMKKQ